MMTENVFAFTQQEQKYWLGIFITITFSITCGVLCISYWQGIMQQKNTKFLV